MTALNRKLLREVWKLRGQLFSIAAVVAVGIMTVLTMRGAYESLVLSQEIYYRDARFPDVWAGLERAPRLARPPHRADSRRLRRGHARHLCRDARRAGAGRACARPLRVRAGG